MRDKAALRELCVACFRYAWLQSILEHVGLTDPIVGAFDPDEHSTVVEEFAQVTASTSKQQQLWVRRCVPNERLPQAMRTGAAALLQQQAVA